MKRFSSQRPQVCLIALLLGMVGVLAWPLWREVQHQRLNRQLIAAVKREDTATALSALAQGADANARDEVQALHDWRVLWSRLRGKHPTQRTALLIAVSKPDTSSDTFDAWDNLPLVRALIAHGANVNVRTPEGYSPLEVAMFNLQYDVMCYLIRHGARVTADPGDDSSPFVEACSADMPIDILELMLQHGADPNETAASYASPLECAIALGRADKVRLLLRYHANPNVRVGLRHESHTALGYVQKYASKDPALRQIVKVLKAAGAKE